MTKTSWRTELTTVEVDQHLETLQFRLDGDVSVCVWNSRVLVIPSEKLKGLFTPGTDVALNTSGACTPELTGSPILHINSRCAQPPSFSVKP